MMKVGVIGILMLLLMGCEGESKEEAVIELTQDDPIAVVDQFVTHFYGKGNEEMAMKLADDKLAAKIERDRETPSTYPMLPAKIDDLVIEPMAAQIDFMKGSAAVRIKMSGSYNGAFKSTEREFALTQKGDEQWYVTWLVD